jgi:hypothetical protein
MISEPGKPWQENGARAAVEAEAPRRFIAQHLSPLFFRHTVGGPPLQGCREIVSEEQFWSEGSNLVLGAVRLTGFRLTDWFPRAPGVYWSTKAERTRAYVWSEESHSDPVLGRFFSPNSKMDLIEDGGIGSIRLRPRRIDGEDCWFATALTGIECHRGIPLAIPDKALREASVGWGNQVNIQGRLRFLQDAGLDDVAASVHHARPIIVFVDELRGVSTSQPREPIIITPVALFDSIEPYKWNRTTRPGYTFVHCEAGSDRDLDDAADWIERYATRFAGRVITNFDEQRPVLADAPLSYQRLVAKTFDRTIIEHFAGTMVVGRVDQVVQEMNVDIGGSANVNIGSTLSNVAQTVASQPDGVGKRRPKRPPQGRTTSG